MANQKKTKKTSKNLVTVQTRTGIVCLNGYASESLHVYVEQLLDVCRRRKIDPRDALINTDEYPQLGRSREVEFAIGWIHGCAEAHDLQPEQLFDAVVVSDEPKKRKAAA